LKRESNWIRTHNLLLMKWYPECNLFKYFTAFSRHINCIKMNIWHNLDLSLTGFSFSTGGDWMEICKAWMSEWVGEFFIATTSINYQQCNMQQLDLFVMIITNDFVKEFFEKIWEIISNKSKPAYPNPMQD